MKNNIAYLVLLLMFFAGCQNSDDPRHNTVSVPHELELAPQPEAIEGNPEISESPWQVESQRKWKYIVIHHSASDFGNGKIFDKWHRDRDFDELGYHFVITNGSGGTNGNIEVGARWEKQKWGAHAGKTPDNEYNNCGIGICVVGNFMKTQPTQKQLDSLDGLVKWLKDYYAIPEGNIITHRDVPGAKTSCPGDMFYSWLQKQNW